MVPLSQITHIGHTAPNTLLPHPGCTVLHIRHPKAPSPVMNGEGPLPVFYVMRPDQSPVPLIPLDELPSWLRIGKWNWNDRSLYNRMALVRGWPIPREGEYHVVCDHRDATPDAQHQTSDHSINELRTGPNPVDCWDDGSWKLPPQALYDALRAIQDSFLPAWARQGWRAMAPADYLGGAQGEEPLTPKYWQDPFVHTCFVQIPALCEIDSNIAAAIPKTPPPALSVGERSPQQTESPMSSPQAPFFSPCTMHSSEPSISPILPPSPLKTPSSDGSDHIWSFESAFDRDSGVSIDFGQETPFSSDGSNHLSSLATDPNSDSGLGIDSGQQSPWSSAGTLTSEELTVLVEQLKRTLGIADKPQESDVESEGNPLPADGQKKDFRTKRWRKYYPVRKRRRVRTERRLRRAADAYKASREIARSNPSTADQVEVAAPVPVAPAPQQTNAATKRRARRELQKLGRKRELESGSRYWHMMMIPSCRSSVPRR